MSTALAKIEASSFIALQEDSQIAEAMAANLGEGATIQESDLTRVPTPSGGATQWTIPSLVGDDHCEDITGILACICARGVLWPSEDPASGTLPVLISHDMKTAELVCDWADVPEEMQDILKEHERPGGGFDWESLPYNEFGSGKGGFGKRVKEQRVMFILREQDALPLVVTAQPGSLKAIRNFIMELVKAGVPHYRAIVQLKLRKEINQGGQPYSQIVPGLTGILSVEDGKQVLETITNPLNAVIKKGGD